MKKYVVPIIILIILIVSVSFILLNKEKGLQIINKNKTCEEERQKFFEDELYIYYLECGYSNNIYIKLNNKSEQILIKEALDKGIISISDLKNKIALIKYSKDE